MTFPVRIFAFDGTQQLPTVRPQQMQTDSVQQLNYPYIFSQLLTTNGTTAVNSIANPDIKARVLRIEVTDGDSIRYEINPPNRNVQASNSSPRLSGVDNFFWGAGYTVSIIEDATGGGGSATGAVRYDSAQSLSAGQTAQARSNIVAPGLNVNNTFAGTQTVSNTVTINTPNASTTPALNINQVGPSVGFVNPVSNPFYYNRVLILQDNVQVQPGPQYTVGFDVYHDLGTQDLGSKVALRGTTIRQHDNTVSGPTTYGDTAGVSGQCLLQAKNGGTNTGAGALGTGFGGFFFAMAFSGALNYIQVCGLEADALILTGASSKSRYGVSANALGDKTADTIYDAAYEIGGASVNGRFKYGILFSHLHGDQGVRTDGTLIGTDSGFGDTVARGIDFSGYAFTGNPITLPSATWDSKGNLTLADAAFGFQFVKFTPFGGTTTGSVNQFGDTLCLSNHNTTNWMLISLLTGVTRFNGLPAYSTQALTLVNGVNSDISVTRSRVRITGPSAPFSITGFSVGGAAPSDGVQLEVYNATAQTMTLTNQATSLAANQIKTLTSANVVLRANATSFATFTYDATESAWILESTN